MNERKKRRDQQLEISREKSDLDVSTILCSSMMDVDDDLDNCGAGEKGKQNDTICENESSTHHVRESIRKVREEVYTVMHMMPSTLHMSKRQI